MGNKRRPFSPSPSPHLRGSFYGENSILPTLVLEKRLMLPLSVVYCICTVLLEFRKKDEIEMCGKPQSVGMEKKINERV